MNGTENDHRTSPDEVPDVTVIVPVYNTMPYLVPCLDSLVAQTIRDVSGPGAVEVLVVDDGSTDDGPALMDRYAETYPDLFQVLRQESSGSPAAPRNRALDLARGRYVFFLDSDDYLSTFALERLVARADEWGSDVVFGRMVGVNGRFVDQRIYATTLPDIGLSHPLLPFALSITKLFRRSLVEEHRLRFDPELRIGSDQPFTAAAMLLAGRVSVLAEDTYYYAVRREDASNISYASHWRTRVRDIGTVMHQISERVPPGELRDNVLHRHFAWELDKLLLSSSWSDLDQTEQVELSGSVGVLVTEFLSDGVSHRLRVRSRLRLRLAQAGRTDLLERMADFAEAGYEPALALGQDRVLLAYPGYGELPEEWFEATSEPMSPGMAAARLSRVHWEGTTLVVDAQLGVDPVSAGQVRVALVAVARRKPVAGQRKFPRGKRFRGHSWPVTLVPAPSTGTDPDPVGSRLQARLDLAVLLDDPDGPARRWALRFHVDIGDQTFDLPAEGARGRAVRVRIGSRFFRFVARRDDEGRMFVRRRRVPLKKVARATARRRLRPALRAGDAVRRRAQQATRKVRRRAEQAGPAAGDGAVPLVSVVLPVSDAQAAYFEVGLRSVLDQRHEGLEILVVPHGRCDRVVASSLLTEDPRVLVCAAVADLGTARDEGAGQARGSYLMFMSASDTIPARALGALATTLEESGSDFAVGRTTGPARWRSLVAALEPPRAQRRTTIGAVPHLVTDTHPGNRLFRTSFWRETSLAFSGAGVAHSPVVEAYLRSGAFDVVEEVTYRDLNRADGTPVGYVRDQMKELAGWLDEQRATLAVLEQSATTEARDTVLLDNWLVDVLEHQTRVFFEDLERADDSQWKALREHLDHLVEVGGEPVQSRLSVQIRLRLWLVQQDARAQLEQLLVSLRLEGVSMRTSVQDGVVRAHYPFEGSDELRIPESCLELTQRETPLRVCLRNVHWTDVHTIELDLFAWIDFVDGRGELPEVEVTLTAGPGGPVLRLAAEQRRDARVNQVVQHRYQDYSGGAMTVRVDAAALVAASLGAEAQGGEPSWQLRIRLGYQGVTREGTVTDVDLRGSAAEMQTMALAPRVVGSRRVAVASDPEVGVRFDIDQLLGVRLVSGEVDGRHVTGELRSDQPVTDLLLRRKDGREVRCRVQVDGERQSFALDLPSVGYAEGETAVRHWRVRAVTADGQEHPVGWPDLGDRWLAASGSAELAFSCSPTGICNVSETTRTFVLDDVALEDRGIRVRGHWLGPVPSTWRVEVSGKWARLQDTPLSSQADDFEALLATTRLEWGRETCIPLGPYRVAVIVGEGDDATVSAPLIGVALNRRLLEEVTGRHFRMRLTRIDRELGIVLEAPRSNDERGAFAQNRLRAEYQENDALQVDPRLVYLECYDGRTATDSQLAIAEELMRVRPDLQLCWGVWDFAAWIPDGVSRVLLHSREWHRVRATAGYLVNNIDFERRFRKRPGQRYLQTFHGQPAKSMGIRMWEGKQLTPRMIRAELDRTSLYWDAILTPSPEMDHYYRREYAYDGVILNQGYPRDDVLVSPQADVVRRRTRELLGISDEQKVVLYAPTWRDNLAVSFSSATSVRHLDIEAASASLGEDYVLLMRGHRFQARTKASAADTPRFIDVTRYPEVNDLILAADAAVLDYSSMRFDFALTGRPMLFLVPDLDDYTGGVRGFLYPYEDTAPGPLLDTAEQVVERLRDLDAVSQEYAERYAAFNATYSYLQDGHSAARVVEAFFGDQR